jgi:hypothetical protein
MKLAPFERRWAAATMTAIYPGSGDEGLAGLAAMDVDGFLRTLGDRLPLRAALGFRLAIWMVALAPLFVLRRLATIAGLALVERERLVDALLASRAYVVRSLALVLKAMGALLYATDTGVRHRLLATRAALVPVRVRPRVHVR